MKKPIGEIIRNLRKERNLTQEELANLLHVSGQAVSRWENGTGMPDISQIVPLASVFGVSTDVLFDMVGKSDDDIANEIIHEAEMLVYDENHVATKNGLYQAYQKVREALIRYPNNILLLTDCLEKGLELAYPKSILYNAVHGNDIYKECIRQANLVISYGKNTTDVLRAHMIMVLLHSQYGNYDSAMVHAKQFPYHVGMNIYNMYAFIHYAKKEDDLAALQWKNDAYRHFVIMIGSICCIGGSLFNMKQYADAVFCFESCLDLIATLFKGETCLPPLHCTEYGNIYLHLAEAHLCNENEKAALHALEQAVDYELEVRPKFHRSLKPQSPLFQDVEAEVYPISLPYRSHIVRLRKMLKSEQFHTLKENPQYIALCDRLEQVFLQLNEGI